MLRNEECRVVEARSSDDFLDLLVEASLPGGDPRQSYDVIITDLVMPGASGLDALRAFGKPLSAIPVVLTSAIIDLDVERRKASLGAVTILQKPFAQEAVRDALGVAFGLVLPRPAL